MKTQNGFLNTKHTYLWRKQKRESWMLTPFCAKFSLEHILYKVLLLNCNKKMADLEQQVMQLTQDLYVLKHTVIAWKTVEEWIKESNTVPEDAMIKEEENRKLKNEIAWYEKEEDRLREENKKLKSDLAFERTMLDNVRAEYKSLQDINKKLKEKVRFLEECLDRKEKVNKSLREELEKLKSTHVYDAKQVRDIC